MNVAGSGIGSLISITFLRISVMPLMIVLILNNMGVYKILQHGGRIFFYFVSYGVRVGLEYLLISWLKEKSMEPFFYFFLYLLLLLFFTYALKSILRSYITNLFFAIFRLTLFVIAEIYIRLKPRIYIGNPTFEKQFVKALGLKYNATDSLYDSDALVIEKDTLAGFYENIRLPICPIIPTPNAFSSKASMT